MKVDTHTVDGRKYDISFSPSTGKFSAELDDDVTITADTLEACKQKMTRAKRKAGVRIALPAVIGEGNTRWDRKGDGIGKFVDVTVTGIHQRNRSILIRRGDTGKAETLDDYRSTLFKPLTKAERAEGLELAKASRDARAAWDKWLESHTFNKASIEHEVTKANKAAGIEEGDDD